MAIDPDKLVTRLRERLGDSVPEGGSDSDAMFTNDRLKDMINENSSFNRAILEGWQIKAAHYVDLVNVTDGAASRELGDLLGHAQAMVNFYNKLAVGGPTAGRSRVGRIVRP